MTATTIARIVEQPAVHPDEALALGALAAGVATADELARFALACEEQLLVAYETPEGRDADVTYSDAARDLLDTLEAWQDDPHGAWQDLTALAA